MIKRSIALVICLIFICQQVIFAQISPQPVMPAYVRALNPPVGAFQPVRIRSIVKTPSLDKIDIYVDPGTRADAVQAEIDTSVTVLMDYFRIGLRLLNSAFWVNLRPDAPERMLDPLLEKTDMGRVLLEADLELKKDLCGLTDPATAEGKEYWDKLYGRAAELYKTEDSIVPTVTRPWIVPGEIVLGETANGVYIYKALLKVMLQHDYIKGPDSIETGSLQQDPRQQELNEYSTKLLKEKIIPILTRTINSSRKYASLRQVYFSLILAQWYKSNIASRLPDIIVDSGDLRGLESKIPWSRQGYFEAYRRSVTHGEYSKEEYVGDQHGITIRQYTSGGAAFVQQPDYLAVTGDLPANRGRMVSTYVNGPRLDGGFDDNEREPEDINASQEPDDAVRACIEAEKAHENGDRKGVARAIDDLLVLNTENKTALKRALTLLMKINKEQKRSPDEEMLLRARSVAERLFVLHDDSYWVKDNWRKVNIMLLSLPGAAAKSDLAGLDDNALFRIVDSLMQQENFLEAKDFIDRIVAIPDTPSDVLAKAGFYRIRIACQEKDIESLSHAVDGLLQDCPDDRNILLKVTSFFFDQKRQRAIPNFKMFLDIELRINTRRIELDPEDYKVQSQRYKILKALGRDEDAAAALAESLRLKRDTKNLHQEYVRLRAEGSYEDALAIIDELIELEPRDIIAHSQKIKLLLDMHRIEEAWDAVLKVEREYPDEVKQDEYILVQKAILLKLRNEYALALEVLNDLDQGARSVALQKISVLLALDDLDGALEVGYKMPKEYRRELINDPSLIRQMILHKRYRDALSLILVLEGAEPDTNSALMGYKFDCWLGLGQDEAAFDILIALEKKVSGGEESADMAERLLDYEDKWLRHVLIKEYMLEGAEKARIMKDRHRDSGKYVMTERPRMTDTYRRLCEHIDHSAERSHEFEMDQIHLSVVRMEHIIQRHRYDKSSTQNSFTGYFPASMDEDAISVWIKAGLHNLFAMRNLPGNDVLDWWPEDVYVSYFIPEGSDELVRMVVVVTAGGRVITLYPTSGPGVFYAIGNEPVSSGIASLNPHRLMVWNRQSRQPIYVLSAGMLALVNDPRLEKLQPAQREQLAWRAVTEGTRAPSTDKENEYYSCPVPAEWQELLNAKTVVVRISVRSNELAGLESLLDGGDHGGIDLRRLPSTQKQQKSRGVQPAYSADELPGINDYLAMVLKREEECAVEMLPDMRSFLQGISLTN